MKKSPTHQSRTDKALRHFTVDCGEHHLTIARDDGVYRHLKFRQPNGHGMYWFDLHTAPGFLTLRGDAGTWVFACTEDMFEFFRQPRINPSYWQEKVIASDRHSTGGNEYDHELLRDAVRECAHNYAEYRWPRDIPEPEWGEDEDTTWSTQRAAFYRDVVDLLRDDMLDHDSTDARGAAIGEVMDFQHTEVIDTGVRDRYFPDRTVKEHKTHHPFTDFYEYGPFEAPGHLFLYCLHALRWGIEQYDKAKATEAAA